MSSVERQERIDHRLQASRLKPTKRFNPVDWFSAQWTLSMDGRAIKYFANGYKGVFDRDHKDPAHYRIKPALYDRVVSVLSELT